MKHKVPRQTLRVERADGRVVTDLLWDQSETLILSVWESQQTKAQEGNVKGKKKWSFINDGERSTRNRGVYATFNILKCYQGSFW